MTTFIKRIGQSVYSPEFYRQLASSSTWRSLGYYLLFAFLVAVVLGLGVSSVVVPTLSRVVAEGLPVAEGLYPKELVITIKGGQAAANVSQPYFIRTPDVLLEKLKNEEGVQIPPNLAVVDTKNSFNAEQFARYNTVIWVARDGFAVIKDAGAGTFSAEFQNYTNDLVINHDRYATLIEKMKGFTEWLPGATVALLMVAFFVWGIVRLVYFLIAAVLVYLLLKVLKQPASYGYAYRLTLHAATLPILLNLALAFFAGNIHPVSTIPFLFTIIILFIVWVNIRALPERTV